MKVRCMQIKDMEKDPILTQILGTIRVTSTMILSKVREYKYLKIRLYTKGSL